MTTKKLEVAFATLAHSQQTLISCRCESRAARSWSDRKTTVRRTQTAQVAKGFGISKFNLWKTYRGRLARGHAKSMWHEPGVKPAANVTTNGNGVSRLHEPVSILTGLELAYFPLCCQTASYLLLSESISLSSWAPSATEKPLILLAGTRTLLHSY